MPQTKKTRNFEEAAHNDQNEYVPNMLITIKKRKRFPTYLALPVIKENTSIGL